MTQANGIFAITLDFELYWGVHHKMSIAQYKDNLLGVYSAVPALLKLFSEYQIHATWATVGFLFYKTFDELKENLPEKKVSYRDIKYNPYIYIDNLDMNHNNDKFYFAPGLIRLIASHPHQEIACHTFSHYYCLEEGHDEESFKKDLEAFLRITSKYGLKIESFVFPGNQVNPEYLSILREMGFKAFRGKEPAWFYKPGKFEEKNLITRGLRLIDAYFNIGRHESYTLDDRATNPINVPACRFLRPYSRRLKYLEPLRRARITSSLTHAAQKAQTYHLYWHPHNFGVDLEENILFLQKILNYFAKLRENYGMESLTLSEIANQIIQRN